MLWTMADWGRFLQSVNLCFGPAAKSNGPSPLSDEMLRMDEVACMVEDLVHCGQLEWTQVPLLVFRVAHDIG